jgi:hypothetical protein
MEILKEIVKGILIMMAIIACLALMIYLEEDCRDRGGNWHYSVVMDIWKCEVPSR